MLEAFPTPYKLKNVHVGLKQPGDAGTKLLPGARANTSLPLHAGQYNDKVGAVRTDLLQTLVSGFVLTITRQNQFRRTARYRKSWWMLGRKREAS